MDDEFAEGAWAHKRAGFDGELGVVCEEFAMFWPVIDGEDEAAFEGSQLLGEGSNLLRCEVGVGIEFPGADIGGIEEEEGVRPIIDGEEFFGRAALEVAFGWETRALPILCLTAIRPEGVSWPPALSGGLFVYETSMVREKVPERLSA